MSKKIIRFLATGVVVFTFSFLSIKIIKAIADKKIIQQSVAHFKPITGLKNNRPFTFTANNITKPYLLLAYLDTDCDHCMYMLQEFNTHQEQFNNCAMLLILKGADTAVQRLQSEFAAAPSTPVQFMQDKGSTIKKQLGIKGVPHFFIYNKQGALVASKQGETRIENLLKLMP